jgi:hypothetical protein
MKHYIASENAAKPKEVFVVLCANLEYNDETYSSYGEAVSHGRYYETQEEAEQAITTTYSDTYGDLRIYELDYMFPDSLYAEKLKDIHGDAYYEMTINQFITFLENQGLTRKETIKYLPDFFSIKKLVENK